MNLPELITDSIECPEALLRDPCKDLFSHKKLIASIRCYVWCQTNSYAHTDERTYVPLYIYSTFSHILQINRAYFDVVVNEAANTWSNTPNVQ